MAASPRVNFGKEVTKLSRMKAEAPLADYYSGWKNYQRLLVKAIAPLTAEQLDIQAGPGLWSVRKLASHVVARRSWLFHDWTGEGGPEFDGVANFDEAGEWETRPAAEIVAGLEKTWSLVYSCLNRWTGADLIAAFQRPVPNPVGDRPWHDRRWIVWHALEHDLHHGGEISFSLGMHGIPGIDI